MGLALSRRLGRAFDRPSVTIAERDDIMASAMLVETFDQLPPRLQALVIDMESRPGPPPRLN